MADQFAQAGNDGNAGVGTFGWGLPQKHWCDSRSPGTFDIVIPGIPDVYGCLRRHISQSDRLLKDQSVRLFPPHLRTGQNEGEMILNPVASDDLVEDRMPIANDSNDAAKL